MVRIGPLPAGDGPRIVSIIRMKSCPSSPPSCSRNTASCPSSPELPVQPLSSVPELLTTLALGFFGFLHQFRRQVQRQAADPLRPFGGAGQRVER